MAFFKTVRDTIKMDAAYIADCSVTGKRVIYASIGFTLASIGYGLYRLVGLCLG